MTSTIYMDNAATTHFKPTEVIDAVTTTLKRYNVNANRNNSPLAIELQQLFNQSRQSLADLVGGRQENVIFTSGCTLALNLALLGNARKGHIVTTCCQHNSTLRPLYHIAKMHGTSVTVVTPTNNNTITASDITSAMRKDTYMVVLNHTSNLTGNTIDLKGISHAVKAVNSKTLVVADCAQSAGYTDIDMASDIDFVALPLHKGLHGMQGIGALICNEKLPNPILFGGTGSESDNLAQPTSLPDGFEAGTQNSSGIVSIAPAIKWVNDNKQYNTNHLACLQNALVDGLKTISNVTLYSTYNNCGIVSIAVGNYDSNYISDYLAERGIITRGGLHCAPLMHKFLDTTQTGLLRLSVGCDNTLEQCYKVLNIIDAIK